MQPLFFVAVHSSLGISLSKERTQNKYTEFHNGATSIVQQIEQMVTQTAGDFRLILKISKMSLLLLFNLSKADYSRILEIFKDDPKELKFFSLLITIFN
ncbi:hypothetical protein Q7A53_12550 [Halobacillus rhizosphaerae]